MEKVKWVRTCRFTHSFLHMSRLLRIPSVVKNKTYCHCSMLFRGNKENVCSIQKQFLKFFFCNYFYLFILKILLICCYLRSGLWNPQIQTKTCTAFHVACP